VGHQHGAGGAARRFVPIAETGGLNAMIADALPEQVIATSALGLRPGAALLGARLFFVQEDVAAP
jgi:delta 1-pyrroline-5-carboxylate dehydrogenase